MSPGAPQDPYQQAPYQQNPVEFPGVVMAAGIIWIVLGGLILLNAAAILLIGATLSAGTRSGELAGMAACSSILVALFGAAFLLVGVQTVKGTAPGTLGNGVGSIIFAVLQFGGAVVQIVAGQIPQGAISFLGGCGLMTAGVLAVVGRRRYMAWRKARPR